MARLFARNSSPTRAFRLLPHGGRHGAELDLRRRWPVRLQKEIGTRAIAGDLAETRLADIRRWISKVGMVQHGIGERYLQRAEPRLPRSP